MNVHEYTVTFLDAEGGVLELTLLHPDLPSAMEQITAMVKGRQKCETKPNFVGAEVRVLVKRILATE